MIERVELVGFKGLTRTYNIARGTVLSGPNGSGKSACIEAIRYALSGRVPAGKSRDAVAQYFSAEGGHVTLVDDAGRWVQRIITRRKTTVSESIEWGGSERLEDAWQASAVVLDLGELLSLSADKRREFILDLCGGDSKDDGADIFGRVEVGFCRLLAGSVATPALIGDGADLSPDEQSIWSAWIAPRGVRESVESVIHSWDRSGVDGVSGLFARLVDACREGLSHARSSAQAAEKARDAMKRDRVPSAAADVETVRQKIAEVQEERTRTIQARTRHEELARQLAAAQADWNASEDRVQRYSAQLAETREAGEKPTVPDPSERSRLKDEMQKVHDEISAISKRHVEFLAYREKESRRLRDLASAEARLAEGDSSPLAKALALMVTIPDEAHPQIRPLRRLIESSNMEWLADVRPRLLSQIETLRQPTPNAPAPLVGSEDDPVDWEEQVRLVGLESERLRGREAEAHNCLLNHIAAEDSARETLARWVNIERQREDLKQCLSTAEAEARKLNTVCADLRRRLAEIRPEDIDLSATDASLERLDAELLAAEEAAAVAAAYDAAVRRAMLYRHAESAWKLVQSAVKGIRETYFGDLVRPLINDANQIFPSPYAPRIYLELESDRGLPAFEIGWERDGVRTPLDPLSGGETALLCVALGLAIARRSPGLRLLLIEAAEIDSSNLRTMLRCLAPHCYTVHNVVIATTHDVSVDPLQGDWNVIDLESVISQGER